MLFYAYENWEATQINEIGLNPDHQRGRWLEHHELAQIESIAGLIAGPIAGKERGFIILPKWHWIGGPRR